MTGHVAITMAGFGMRFQSAGYRTPKYQIEVAGRPLFDWSMMSLFAFRDAGWTFSFAIRAADRTEDFIQTRCRALDIKVESIHLLVAPTDGQATTAFIIADALPGSEEPFLVYNIDTYVTPYALSPGQINRACAGWIPCFPGPGSGWSFARIDSSGSVVELREKQRISDHATVGLYWFASSELFRETYKEYFAFGNEEKGERYIAPMYNHLIGRGQRVDISDLALRDVGMLGTPDQVEAFRASPPPSISEWPVGRL